MNQLPNQKRVQMTIAELEALPHIICPKCQFGVFLQGFKLKRQSPILSQSGRTEVIPIQTFVCAACHRELLPKEAENEPTKPEAKLPDVTNQ